MRAPAHGRKGSAARRSLLSCLVFFLLIAATVTVALAVHESVRSSLGEHRGAVAAVMLCVILGIALLATAVDALRRRLFVERPVALILSAAESIAAGDFSVRLSPHHSWGRYDDYDAIMDDLNTVAVELGKSELLKTDFISNVSHEIKTPLSVIKSYSEFLARGGGSEEERRRAAETLASASRRLSGLVSNVLKLNKLENQGLLSEKTELRLDSLLTDCILSFEDAVEEKGLSLDCDIAEFYVRSSEPELEIVFNNLLSNAIKFTERGGSVSVSLKAEGDNAVVTVRDSGCGISAEDGARIFEKFYQADGSHSSEGNGLGLALVKRVVDMLGGEISVESELGRGSRFTVTLKGCVL